jgi:hypothetical protein
MVIKFKGVDLDGDLERMIPHVAAAEEYGGALQHLQSVWDNAARRTVGQQHRYERNTRRVPRIGRNAAQSAWP